MEIVKKFLFAIILLAVIALVWVGTTFFFRAKDTSIIDGAQPYTTQIPRNFKNEELDKVYERSEDSFPVSSKEFTDLIGQTN